jgi:membrane protease YdiL (CAAX protease family)
MLEGRDAAVAPVRPPRVWTVFVAYVAVVLGMLAVVVVILLVALAAHVVRDPGLLHDPAAIRAAVGAALSSSGVQIAFLTATAAVPVAVALVAGRLSPEPARTRLSLGPSRLGPGAIAVAVLGCVAISSTFDAGFGALGLEQTGSIARFGRVLVGLSPSALALMLLAGGIAGPIAEELFFRGYVQNRLCRRWGAWTGVLASAALFGLMHMDWIHTPSAFLIGAYLGWLVHRSGSIRPAIAAHAVNNVVWVLATSAGLGSSLPRGVHAALLAVYLAVAAVAVGWLRRRVVVE